MTFRIAPMPVLITALIWIGMLIGVSFMATPIKFAAPSLQLPVALDVGRYTFALLNRVEIVGCALLSLFVILGLRRRRAALPLLVLVALIAVQTLWLLPVLDARVELIQQGQMPSSSPLHSFYIGAEALKLVCLAALAFVAAHSLKSAAREQEQ